MIRFTSRVLDKKYFIAIFVIWVTLFFVFSLVIYRHYKDAQALNEAALYNYEVVRQSDLVLSNLAEMESSVLSYLLTGQESFLESYNKAIKTFPEKIDEIRNLTKDDKLAYHKINSWLKKNERFHDLLINQMNIVSPANRTEVATMMLKYHKQELEVMRSMLEGDIIQRFDRANHQIGASRTEQHNFFYILVIGTVLTVAAMLLATIAVINLITRNQKIEDEALLANERFKDIMGTLNEAIFDLNLEDQSMYYSPAYKTMLGYSDAEHADTFEAFKSLIHPDEYNRVMEGVTKYKNRDTPHYTSIFRLRHKNCSWRWILARGVGFWDQHGKMIRFTATHTDITEQKQREEELKQLNEDLETFTYIASHDLRSPLVNLKGFVQELEHSVERIKPIFQSIQPHITPIERQVLTQSFEDDMPEAVRFIKKATDRMDTLITALLDLSYIGKHEYLSVPVDTQAIVQKCLAAQAYEISRREAEVTCEPLPQVTSDPMALEHVFSNLLDNAVKYLHDTRKGRITISAKENETDFVFIIQDNGRGIADVDREKIFAIFRRARNTGDIRGLGMGMAFVKSTLRKLGGSIWCESAVDNGTTFYFRLPKHLARG